MGDRPHAKRLTGRGDLFSRVTPVRKRDPVIPDDTIIR